MSPIIREVEVLSAKVCYGSIAVIAENASAKIRGLTRIG
jgi:hypothetical protein